MVVVLALGCAACPQVFAFQNLESALRRNGTTVMNAFEPSRQVLQASSAVISEGRREIAYGTVVGAQGLILTKASELKGCKNLVVRVDVREFREVRVLAEDPAWDVALLKVEAQDLVPVRWSEQAAVSQGTWVVANGATSRTRRRALAGIVSAKTREIKAAGGAGLGVVLEADTKQLRIADVVEGGGGKAAGLKKGDVILSIDGKAVKERQDMLKRLESRKAGEIVKVGIRREEQELEIEVRLSPKAELFSDQMSRNDAMSGRFSERRSGFPRVMQHDILGARSSMGGPVLDLDGRCVGVNIARANRSETFAIPAADAVKLVAKLAGHAAAPAGR
jgi:serine protease Do